jgi:hypothetical protein
VDEFLFETRTGYCEHFASAFAFLMRAAGIPSRIVGGYLGGEYNEFGGYWTVRQADAHAWVEVWLPQTGWMRVDPTLAVAPERLTADTTPAAGAIGSESWFKLRWPQTLQPHLKRLRKSLDALNTLWLRNILGYSRHRQRALWSTIGSRLAESSKALVILGLVAGAAALLVYTGLQYIRIRRHAPHDAISHTYQRFCLKMERIGLARHPATGPRDYARHIARRRMDLKPTVYRIIELYIRLRYAEDISPGDALRFKRLVRSFKLR